MMIKKELKIVKEKPVKKTWNKPILYSGKGIDFWREGSASSSLESDRVSHTVGIQQSASHNDAASRGSFGIIVSNDECYVAINAQCIQVGHGCLDSGVTR